MGFASVDHAERHIVHMLADGPMGDDDMTFSNVLTRGMAVTDSVLAKVYQAVDNLESRGRIVVVRNPASGRPQMVELCVVQDPVPVMPPPALSIAKRSLSKFELLKEMHDVLKEMSDDNGVIHSNKHYDDFVKSLHRRLSGQFGVDPIDVVTVFDAMTTLGLRGNARCLRGVGMWVLQESLADLVSDDDVSDLAALREYAESTRLNLEQTSEQLTAAQAEIERLNGELDDVRGKHVRATEQIATQKTDLESVTMSRNQLRENNEKLKAFPRTLRAYLDEMVSE